MAEMPDFGTVPDNSALIHIGRFMNKTIPLHQFTALSGKYWKNSGFWIVNSVFM
jgi:hypothetical protein